MSQKDRKMVVLSKISYDRIDKLGGITDSFDSVISKLLDVAEPILEQKKLQTDLGVGCSSSQSVVLSEAKNFEQRSGS
jgi:hypothetical protein